MRSLDLLGLMMEGRHIKMTHNVGKHPCSLCGVYGDAETVWVKETGKYILRVKCKNPMCPSNRVDLQ